MQCFAPPLLCYVLPHLLGVHPAWMSVCHPALLPCTACVCTVSVTVCMCVYVVVCVCARAHATHPAALVPQALCPGRRFTCWEPCALGASGQEVEWPLLCAPDVPRALPLPVVHWEAHPPTPPPAAHDAGALAGPLGAWQWSCVVPTTNPATAAAAMEVCVWGREGVKFFSRLGVLSRVFCVHCVFDGWVWRCPSSPPPPPLPPVPSPHFLSPRISPPPPSSPSLPPPLSMFDPLSLHTHHRRTLHSHGAPGCDTQGYVVSSPLWTRGYLHACMLAIEVCERGTSTAP
jgi:hypothetical protein